jgi:hypothetical protein
MGLAVAGRHGGDVREDFGNDLSTAAPGRAIGLWSYANDPSVAARG